MFSAKVHAISTHMLNQERPICVAFARSVFFPCRFACFTPPVFLYSCNSTLSGFTGIALTALPCASWWRRKIPTIYCQKRRECDGKSRAEVLQVSLFAGRRRINCRLGCEARLCLGAP